MNSLLQLRVDDRMRGRGDELYTLSFFGLSPFGSLGAGALAEYLPLSLTVTLTGLAHAGRIADPAVAHPGNPPDVNEARSITIVHRMP